MKVIATQRASYAIFMSIVLLIVTYTLFLTLHSPRHTPMNDESEIDMVLPPGFEYLGAFRLPYERYGDSSFNSSAGAMAYNPLNHSLFIVGHIREQAIAELKIPEIRRSLNLRNLTVADKPIQEFHSIFAKVEHINEEKLDRITGLKLVRGRLLINAIRYYDAPAKNTSTTLILDEPLDLENTPISRIVNVEGGAFLAGWIEDFPAKYRSIYPGDLLMGSASNYPINSRMSQGPSLFVVESDEILGLQSTVPSIQLLSYTLKNPLHSDVRNVTGKNNLWTRRSRAYFGFVIPGTTTYATLGYSAGHNSRICYKNEYIKTGDESCKSITPNNCFGYCVVDRADYYNYFWYWDVDELVRAQLEGQVPYDSRPFIKGEIDLPFIGGNLAFKRISGAAFDENSSVLYVLIQAVEMNKNTRRYTVPLIAVFTVSLPEN